MVRWVHMAGFDTILRLLGACTLAASVALSSCHEPEDDLHAGAACADPDECYPEADPAEIAGEVMCLGKVEGGYCTHTCTSDADCCAAEGECPDGFPQVCSPFESAGMMMCFLSCETQDIDRDPTAFCQEEAHPAFGCRSSGGGSQNRKVCVP